MKFVHAFAALSLAFASPVYPEGLPDLGDSSEAAFPAAEERAIGGRIMREIRIDRDYVADPELNDYLNELGRRLVSASADPGQDFEFFLVRDPALNAFALPGGYIGVNTGLILSTQSESELASVLAHEIGHIVQHHIARMIAGQKQTAIASLATLALAILASRSSSQGAEAAIATAQASAIQSQLNFTREHEREADRVGLQILERSGFNTHAMPAFFERLQRVTRLYDSKAPSYLRTHPLTTERIADIQNRVDKLAARPAPDSLDFQLVRAKVSAYTGSPREAMQLFDAGTPELKFGPTAKTYGVATTLERARDFGRADRDLTQLRASSAPHPMIETLAAELKRDLDHPGAALEIYRSALQRFPHHRALIYGEVDTLLQVGKTEEALRRVSERLLIVQGDYRLFELQAKSYAALGKKLLQHRAQAEAYVRQGNLPAAVEQLQIAVRSGDGDFYQLSGAEARLKELRVLALAEDKKPK